MSAHIYYSLNFFFSFWGGGRVLFSVILHSRSTIQNEASNYPQENINGSIKEAECKLIHTVESPSTVEVWSVFLFFPFLSQVRPTPPSFIIL